MEITLESYHERNKHDWDGFIQIAHNGTLYFFRDFINCHKHRFQEHSLLIKHNKRILACFPSTTHEQTVESYGGLPFGGLIFSKTLSPLVIFRCMYKVITYFINLGYTRLVYKPVPTFYHPFQREDEQLIFNLLDARLLYKEFNLVIPLQQARTFQQRKQRNIAKAKKYGLELVSYRQNVAVLPQYWAMLENNLKERYQVSPTHQLTEIEYLLAIFPNNIGLITTLKDGQMVAGVVYIQFREVIHLQYIASNAVGKSTRAVDFAVNNIINTFSTLTHLSLGISDYRSKPGINKSLFEWKSGFGAVVFEHTCYNLDLKRILLTPAFV